MRGLIGRILSNQKYEASTQRRQRGCRLEVAGLEDRTLAFVGTITAAATPAILFPPNGRFVRVVVTGTITESLKNAPKAIFQVTDEYRRLEPRGRLSLHPVNGNTYSYAFTISLQAARSDRVPDGRHYDILVAAGDAENGNGKTIAVVVPRDLEQARMLLKPRPAVNPNPRRR